MTGQVTLDESLVRNTLGNHDVVLTIIRNGLVITAEVGSGKDSQLLDGTILSIVITDKDGQAVTYETDPQAQDVATKLKTYAFLRAKGQGFELEFTDSSGRKANVPLTKKED
ncbi:hypothetical protein FRC07_001041 [Ceratobasidium sp. 392]|nr:hypothetical protein FRC07_001041 [Ceratobasidium sp. 392]